MTMTHEQIIDLLSIAAVFDQRNVGEADVLAWHEVLGDLPFDDARQAVFDHYRDSRERVMPADIRGRVRATQARRLAAAPDEPPPGVDPDDTQAWLAALTEQRRRIAEGENADPQRLRVIEPRGDHQP